MAMPTTNKTSNLETTITARWPQFDLGRLHHIQRYPHGQHNQTFLVESGRGRFSFRVYQYKKPSQIKFEIALLDCLNGLKVPRLVRLGKRFLTTINGKYAIAYAYLPGTTQTAFTRRQLEEVGMFIADFQKRGTRFRWTRKRYKFYHLPDAKIRKFKRISGKARVPYLFYLPRIIKELKENRLDTRLPQGPIHVDIKPENTLFHRGKLSGVIDFDNAYIGPLLLDLAKSMVWFGIKHKRFNINSALHIYTGFRKKKRLSKAEYAQLYRAVKFAFLSHIFVDYYMRAIKATTKEYFDFIIKDLYAAYRTFTLSEPEFYRIFRK